MKSKAEYYYTIVNKNLFGGELPQIPIYFNRSRTFTSMIQEKNGVPMRIILTAADKKMDKDHDTKYAFVTDLLYGMVHVYCAVKGIPHGKNEKHTPEFVEAAEEHGLFFNEEFNMIFLLKDMDEILKEKD